MSSSIKLHSSRKTFLESFQHNFEVSGDFSVPVFSQSDLGLWFLRLSIKAWATPPPLPFPSDLSELRWETDCVKVILKEQRLRGRMRRMTRSRTRDKEAICGSMGVRHKALCVGPVAADSWCGGKGPFGFGRTSEQALPRRSGEHGPISVVPRGRFVWECSAACPQPFTLTEFSRFLSREKQTGTISDPTKARVSKPKARSTKIQSQPESLRWTQKSWDLQRQRQPSQRQRSDFW